MAGISTCVGMRRISAFGVASDGHSHSLLSCSMSTPVGRNGLHVRHLGSSHSLKSCRSLIHSRSDRLRPAVPRQGRLLCQAAEQQARVSLGTRAYGSHEGSVQRHCTCAMLQNPFRQAREMDGVQKALAGLPGAVFYGAALLLITAAGALGYTTGSRAPGEQKCCHHIHCHTISAFSHTGFDMLCYILTQLGHCHCLSTTVQKPCPPHTTQVLGA